MTFFHYFGKAAHFPIIKPTIEGESNQHKKINVFISIIDIFANKFPNNKAINLTVVHVVMWNVKNQSLYFLVTYCFYKYTKVDFIYFNLITFNT